MAFIINFNAVLDQVLKAYGKLRAFLDYLLRVYPIRRALGLFLVATIAIGTALVAYSKKEGEGAAFHLIIVLLLGAAFALLADRERQFAEFNKLSANTFGRLSLLETNEEDRRQVAKVIAVVEFLKLKKEGAYDFANFFEHLDEFMDAGKNILEIQGKLQDALEGLQKEPFDPPYLQSYVRALLGMTYLKGLQNPANGQHALDSIMKAQEELESRYPFAQVSSILNARGICRALLSQDEKSMKLRGEYLLAAAIDFASSANLGHDAPSMYRFRVNYAEWCVRAYHQWESLEKGQRTEFETRLLACFREIQKFSDGIFAMLETDSEPAQAIAILFDSACHALADAIVLTKKEGMGSKRPIAHLSSFWVGVAAHGPDVEGRLASLSNDYRKHFLNEKAVYEHLDILFKEWKGIDHDRIRQTVMEQPNLDTWLHNWDSLWQKCEPLLKVYGKVNGQPELPAEKVALEHTKKAEVLEQ